MRVLVAYSASSTHTRTTLDYLESFARFLLADVEYIHVTHGANTKAELESYDAIILSYCARIALRDYVSPIFTTQLRDYRGTKILSVQDEYEHTEHLREAIAAIGFDHVLTCVPESSIELVYPKSLFPNTTFTQVLTGYVPEFDASDAPIPLPARERSIDVGYRGRNLGIRYGSLGALKSELGRRFAERASDFPELNIDVSIDDNDRIYGDDWFRFISSTKLMLGCESGSNLFNLDGRMDRIVTRFGSEANLAGDKLDAFLQACSVEERGFSIGQISPRAFECALLGTPMALIEGSYSGILEANRHYVPIRSDFSNIEEVIEKSQDDELLGFLAANAFEDLIQSKRYTYRSFVNTVSALIPGCACVATEAEKQPLKLDDPEVLSGDGFLEFPSHVPKTWERVEFQREIAQLERLRQDVSNIAEMLDEHVDTLRQTVSDRPLNPTQFNPLRVSSSARRSMDNFQKHSTDFSVTVTQLKSITARVTRQADLTEAYVEEFEAAIDELWRAERKKRLARIIRNCAELAQTYSPMRTLFRGAVSIPVIGKPIRNKADIILKYW